MLNRINYYWRVLATGLCFLFCFCLFGFGGLFLSLTVFPLQRLLVRGEDKQKEIARKTVHYIFKFFIFTMGFTGIFRFSLEKAQALKHLKGHLILANHPSLIDVVVLISIIPNADCIVKTHLFSNFFLRRVIKNLGYISNADPEGLLSDCEKSLAAGHNLIVFPQGTRSKPDELLSFQRGAANIAVRCQAKVTSVMLIVVPTTLTKSEPWYRVPNVKANFCAVMIDKTPEVPGNDTLQVAKKVRHYNRDLEFFFIKELKQYE